MTDFTTHFDPDEATAARQVELHAVAEATQTRTAAAADAARQEAWTLERPKLALKHAEWRRYCEDTQTPYVDPAPLPMRAPDWFRSDDGEPVEHEAHAAAEVPDAFSGSHNPIGQAYAATAAPEPTPEMIFAAAAAKPRLFGRKR